MTFFMTMVEVSRWGAPCWAAMRGRHPVVGPWPYRDCMTVHHTTFVLPPTELSPHATPFVVFGADTEAETEQIPLVTSLHRIGNLATPFSHVNPVLGVFPVSDAWARAVGEDYDGRAKVVILREPVPTGISTEDADLARGVLGPDPPAWTGILLAGRIRAASRDVPVTSGTGVGSIGCDPPAPTGSIAAWAHQLIPPQ